MAGAGGSADGDEDAEVGSSAQPDSAVSMPSAAARMTALTGLERGHLISPSILPVVRGPAA